MKLSTELEGQSGVPLKLYTEFEGPRQSGVSSRIYIQFEGHNGVSLQFYTDWKGSGYSHWGQALAGGPPPRFGPLFAINRLISGIFVLRAKQM